MVTHAYPRSEGDVAGAFIERLALALQSRSHDISVVAPADRGRGGREVQKGVSVSRVRYAPRSLETLAYTGTMVESARSPLGFLAAANLVRAQAAATALTCRAAAIDVVHAHWWIPAGLSAWMARLGAKRPFLVTLHGTDVRILERSRIGRMLARRVLRAAAGVTAVSSYLAGRIASMAQIDEANIAVQPMPVQVEHYDRASTGGAGVAVVGRLTKQKNLGLVLEALTQLKRDGIAVPLKLIGDGPERGALERHARDLNVLDQVQFLGAVNPSDVPNAIGNADVSVFPAADEGFGLAAAESLMLGIPVVALESGGGVKDVVPRSGPGRLVPADDPASMAEAVAEFLNNDEGRRKAAETGRKLKERLNPDTVASAFESVYSGAIGGRS